MKTDPQLID